MNIPVKTLANGFSMPVFGMGTWQMGGKKEHDPTNDDERDIKAIQTAIDSGITHIDTAEKYAARYAETLTGKAIKNYDRSKLFLVSKVASHHLTYDEVIAAAKGTLERLGTNYLDLYLIHAPSEKNVPIQETMKAMDFLLEKGLIRNIGVSNFTVEQFEEAQSCTKNKIVANQLHYNLLIREIEKKGLLDFCQKNDVMLVAWRPVQKGMLAEESNPLMDEMCKRYHKTAAQIAINWLISQHNVVTLSKMSNPAHIEENLGAIGWEMDKQDIEKLRKDFPGQEDVSDAVPLK